MAHDSPEVPFAILTSLSGIHFPLQMQTLDWKQLSKRTYFLLTSFTWKPCEFGELDSFLCCTERTASLEVILYRKFKHLNRVWWIVLLLTNSWMVSFYKEGGKKEGWYCYCQSHFGSQRYVEYIQLCSRRSKATWKRMKSALDELCLCKAISEPWC